MNSSRENLRLQLKLGDDPSRVILARAWRGALKSLAEKVSRPTFEGYIRPIEPKEWDKGVVRLAVPSAFAREWLKGRYTAVIQEALEAALANRVTVQFFVEPPPAARDAQVTPCRRGPRLYVLDEERSEPATSETPQPADHQVRRKRRADGAPDWLATLDLNPRFTFDRFVVGASNRMALAAATVAAESPGGPYNPLFLHGPSGVGKTHLLHAIANRARELYPDMRFGFVDAESFTYRYLSALASERVRAFRDFCDGIDLWLVDDVQFIADREQAREEFSHTLNELSRTRRQVVLSSDRAPADLRLDERIRSRLEGGLVVAIAQPDLETRITLVERAAGEAAKSVPGAEMPFPSEIAYFIANGIRTNVRSLEGAVTRLLAYCRTMGAPLTVDVATEVLAPYLAESPRQGWMRKGVSMEAILTAVAEQFGVTVEALRGPQLDRRTVRARQAAMYLCRQFTEQGYTHIGEALGGRDHATVKRGAARIQAQLDTDHRLRADLEQAQERFSR